MSNEKRRILGSAIIIAGVVLILAALLLVVYNNWESNRAGEASDNGVVELESIIFNNRMNDGQFDAPDYGDASGDPDSE